MPYQVVKGPAGDTRIFIRLTGQTYTSQEISAMMLGKLMKDAVAYLGGGTFDVSVLEVGEGVVEVKAANGILNTTAKR